MRTTFGMAGFFVSALLAATGAAWGADHEVGQTGPSVAAASGDPDVLLARARAYWNARGTRSNEVWEFYAPPSKGGPSAPRDVSEFGNVRYTSWKVEGAEVDGDHAIVQVQVRAHFPLHASVAPDDPFWERSLREEWLRVDGVWFKKPIPLGFSRAAAPPASNGAAAPTESEALDANGANP